jgi:hypothetical protein
MLIYTEKTTSRITYILDVMLGNLLGIKYILTNDPEVFKTHTGPKFSYAAAPIADELFFGIAALMTERSIDAKYHPEYIEIIKHEELTGFFAVATPSLLPFDVFASAFYMITRYEEYLILNQRDHHGRFHAGMSVAERAGILEHPIVNYYVRTISQLLLKRYPELTFTQPTFQYLSTIDVDMAYSYLHKGFWRNAGAFFKEIFAAKWSNAWQRIIVLLRLRPDPFDTFDYLRSVSSTYGHAHLFFFLMGDHSEHDKNVSYKNPAFRKLVDTIAYQFPIGIHLSYNSHHRKKGYSTEMARLEEVAHVDITRNRFHFLKFKIPDTFTEVAFAGIKEEYSMGHASKPGFRAGIAHPYMMFDLNTNRIKEVKVYPFMYMDATMLFYKNLRPATATDEVKVLMERTAEVGGLFVSIWHNNSLCEQKEWTGWRQVYEYTHELAAKLSTKNGNQPQIFNPQRNKRSSVEQHRSHSS